jgi:hypothetical protein
MTKSFRVPVEIIVKVEDVNDFAAHVLDRGALDNDQFKGAWYLPERDDDEPPADERQRFNMALQAAIDWVLRSGMNTPPAVAQIPVWHLGGWYHHTPEIDTGHPLR